MTSAAPARPGATGATGMRFQLAATVAASVALVTLAVRPPQALSAVLAAGVLTSGVVGLRRLQRERDPLEAWTVAGLVVLGLLIGAGMLLNVLPGGLDRLNLTAALAIVATAAVALAVQADGDGLLCGWSRPGIDSRQLARLWWTLRHAHLIRWALAVLAVLVVAAVVLGSLGYAVRTERATLRSPTTQLYLRSGPAEQIVVVNREGEAHRYQLVRTSGANSSTRLLVLEPGESRAVDAVRPRRGQATYQLFDLDAPSSAPVASLRLSAPATSGEASSDSR